MPGWVSKTYKNQLGIDASYLIKTHLLFSEYSYPDIPLNIITYKRLFNKWNFRAAFGSSFSNSFPIPSLEEDSNTYQNKSFDLNLSIGLEQVKSISEKWLMYYGVDIIGRTANVDNDVNYYNSGYANGNINTTQQLGIAPLLGIGFKINDRINLTTESSLALIVEKISNTRTYLPVTDLYPEKPSIVDPEFVNIYTAFTLPLVLIINFKL
ncbi:MAG: hypothetical protein IPI65_02940 [Bacteroidetes bacterium]|nr:hypothetical protein [Bacteroidota bacterium]